jgi:hypothetical protein
LAPADTFDNVKGSFQLASKFGIQTKKEVFESVNADVYDKRVNFIGKKFIYALNKKPIH